MKVSNIKDVEKFFEVVDSCTGRVELVTGEGDRLNLKSTTVFAVKRHSPNPMSVASCAARLTAAASSASSAGAEAKSPVYISSADAPACGSTKTEML